MTGFDEVSSCRRTARIEVHAPENSPASLVGRLRYQYPKSQSGSAIYVGICSWDLIYRSLSTCMTFPFPRWCRTFRVLDLNSPFSSLTLIYPHLPFTFAPPFHQDLMSTTRSRSRNTNHHGSNNGPRQQRSTKPGLSNLRIRSSPPRESRSDHPRGRPSPLRRQYQPR